MHTGNNYNLLKIDITAFFQGNHSFLENILFDSKTLPSWMTIESRDDCALFYQIREHIKANIYSEDENCLLKHLLIVDFGHLFDNEKNIKSLSYLFAKNGGITIEFHDGETISYVPFDKSGSMSREGQMSFINKNILHDIDRRLFCGIEFDKANVCLSKFYAYKGLYLSSGYRINPKLLKINSTNVVILKDRKLHETGAQAIPVIKMNTSYEVLPPTTQKHIINNLFDGQGLISDEYTNIINRELGLISTKEEDSIAHSFQIRLPFTKGMLHNVDFKGFLKEYQIAQADDTGKYSYKVKDIFGIERDLMQADIILTNTMFKIGAVVKNKDSAIEEYFEQFNAFNHALYITKTDQPFAGTKQTTLNYQILNTLALPNDKLRLLAQKHLDYIDNPTAYVLDNFADNNKKSWIAALKANNTFAHDNYIKGKLKTQSNALISDLAFGEIRIDGQMRFLARDLLSFLLMVLDVNEQNCKKFNLLKTKQLHPNSFYMPATNIRLENNKPYAFFRNPHLSRNEQCLLTPYYTNDDKKNLYQKYFGKLSGIVMVAKSSYAPATLGGADFDGDFVKITANEIVVDSVLSNTYDKAAFYESGTLLRVLPIVDIDIVGNPKTANGNQAVSMRYNHNYDFNIIKNTFSNNIGRLSNIAIALGMKEYYSVNGDTSGHKPFECTILTGLEIDKAKTGVIPDTSAIFDYYAAEKLDKLTSPYLKEFKPSLEDFNNKSGIAFDSLKENKKTDGSIICLDSWLNNTSIKIPVLTENVGINYLPMLFYEQWQNYNSPSGKTIILPGDKESNRYIYFDFMRDHTLSSNSFTEKIRAVATIIKAYNDIIFRFKTTKSINNSAYSRQLQAILHSQYPEHSDIQIMADIDEMTSLFEDTFEDKQMLATANEELKETIWPYLYTLEEKKSLLSAYHVDDSSTSALEKITNFTNKGYLLLYLLFHTSVYEKVKGNVSMNNNLRKHESYHNALMAFYKIYETATQNFSGTKKFMAELNEEIALLINKQISTLSEEDQFKILFLAKNKANDTRYFWDNCNLDILQKMLKGDKSDA